jgi:hypothetical protein
MGKVWSGKDSKPTLFCGNRKGTKERAFASIQAVVTEKKWRNKIKIRKCNDLPHHFTEQRPSINGRCGRLD